MKQQINLIDSTLLPKVEHLPARAVAMFTAVAMAALGAHYGYERFLLNRTIALAKVNDERVAALNPSEDVDVAGPLSARQRALARDEALRDGLARLNDLPVGNSLMLSSLIAALPGSLWLKEIEFAGKGGVRIVGGATDPTALAEYSDRLAQVPALRGVPVNVVTLEPLAIERDEEDSIEQVQQQPLQYHFVVATTAKVAAP
jgi:hypothetical protein